MKQHKYNVSDSIIIDFKHDVVTVESVNRRKTNKEIEYYYTVCLDGKEYKDIEENDIIGLRGGLNYKEFVKEYPLTPDECFPQRTELNSFLNLIKTIGFLPPLDISNNNIKEQDTQLFSSLIRKKVINIENKTEDELLLLERLITVIKKKINDNRYLKSNLYPESKTMSDLEKDEYKLNDFLYVFMFHVHNEIMNNITLKRNNYNLNKEENVR